MIVLTDPHGNFDTLMKLLSKIPKEEKDKGIVIAGDLIDRGYKSKQVVQWCMDNDIDVCIGNHEVMMVEESDKILEFISYNGYIPSSGSQGSLWLLNGGYETLLSYEYVDHYKLDDRGMETRVFDTDIFKSHIKWMKTLPYYMEYKDIKNKEGRHLVVSHSNIGNIWELRDQNNDKFINQVTWGRPDIVVDIPSIYNIIGHTPQFNGPLINKHFSNIDGGCFYKNIGYGKLIAIQYPEMIVYEQENIDGA